MDAAIKFYPITIESIKSIFDAILSVPIDDGVKIILKKIENIRDEDDYNGFIQI